MSEIRGRKRNKQEMTGFVNISFRIYHGQLKVLDEVCDLAGQSRSDILREALKAHIYPLRDRLIKQSMILKECEREQEFMAQQVSFVDAQMAEDRK